MKIQTPLRYPGGKSTLYEEVLKIIQDNNLQDKTYIEPFSGGFGIGIKLMLNNEIQNFIINDYDYHIYALWKAVFFKTKLLIEKIDNCNISIEEWNTQKNIYDNYKNFNIVDVGFSTLFLNRTNYSGILKSGPIGGFEQTGDYKIDCRFNKQNIKDIILRISKYKKHVKVYRKDAIKLINWLRPIEDQLFYNFDPPYVIKGKELYKNFYENKNHVELKNQIDTINEKWIMTYDNTEFIKNLYGEYNIVDFDLSYSVGISKTGKEVLISNFEINDFNIKESVDQKD